MKRITHHYRKSIINALDLKKNIKSKYMANDIFDFNHISPD